MTEIEQHNRDMLRRLRENPPPRPDVSDEYRAEEYAREPETVRKYRDETVALPGLLEQALTLAELEFLEDRLNPILRRSELGDEYVLALLMHARITAAIRRRKFSEASIKLEWSATPFKPLCPYCGAEMTQHLPGHFQESPECGVQHFRDSIMGRQPVPPTPAAKLPTSDRPE